MSWLGLSRKIVWDEHAVTKAATANLDRISAHLGQQVHVTASGLGLVTESQLESEVRAILSGDNKLTVGLISTKVDVARPVVTAIVDRLWPSVALCLKLSDDLIYSAQENQRLLELLLSQVDHAGGYVSTAEFCSRNKVDSRVLAFLVDSTSHSLAFLRGSPDNLVMVHREIDRCQQEIVSKLRQLQEPCELGAVAATLSREGVAGPVFTALIARKDQVQAAAEGTVRQDTFVPQSYVSRVVKETLETLDRTGIVQLEPQVLAFVERPLKTQAQERASGTIQTLDQRIVFNERFVAKVNAQVEAGLEAHGIVDVESINNLVDTEVVFDDQSTLKFLQLAAAATGSSCKYLDRYKCVVRPKFEIHLRHRLRELVAQVSESCEQESQIQVSRYQEAVLAAFAAITSKNAQAYIRSVAQEYQQEYQTAARKALHRRHKLQLLAEAKLHLLGVQWARVRDAKFGLKLRLEFVRHYQEQKIELDAEDGLHIDGVSERALDVTAEELDKLLVKEKSAVMATWRDLLKDTTDPALILHLSIVLVQASCYDGVLRITGKHVPKVLRLLVKDQEEDSASIWAPHLTLFTSLKDEIVNKAETSSAVAVKNAVLSVA